MLAWHFTKGNKLRDGRPIPKIGKTLIHTGEVNMCESGLHASKKLLDALKYAPGSTLHRVNCEDIVEKNEDKFVCKKRTILWSLNIKDILKKFAKECALDVIHLWNAPQIVIECLKTGNKDIAARAYTAVRVAEAAAEAAVDAAAVDAAAYAAADTAARAVAYAATKKKQNKRLTQMVMAKHKKEDYISRDHKPPILGAKSHDEK